jgi:hypothetical protein
MDWSQNELESVEVAGMRQVIKALHCNRLIESILIVTSLRTVTMSRCLDMVLNVSPSYVQAALENPDKIAPELQAAYNQQG